MVSNKHQYPDRNTIIPDEHELRVLSPGFNSHVFFCSEVEVLHQRKRPNLCHCRAYFLLQDSHSDTSCERIRHSSQRLSLIVPSVGICLSCMQCEGIAPPIPKTSVHYLMDPSHQVIVPPKISTRNSYEGEVLTSIICRFIFAGQ
jgi:hypothetical protein